jgi:hypothetical protein
MFIDDATGQIYESRILIHSQPNASLAQRFRFWSLFAALYWLLPAIAIWLVARLVLSVSTLYATVIAFAGAPIIFCALYTAIVVISRVTYKRKRVSKKTAA